MKTILLLVFVLLSSSLTAQRLNYKAIRYSTGKVTASNKITLLSTDKSNDLINIDLRDMKIYITGGQEFPVIQVLNKNPHKPMYICTNHTAIKLDKINMTLSILYDYDLEQDDRMIVVYKIKAN